MKKIIAVIAIAAIACGNVFAGINFTWDTSNSYATVIDNLGNTEHPADTWLVQETDSLNISVSGGRICSDNRYGAVALAQDDTYCLVSSDEMYDLFKGDLKTTVADTTLSAFVGKSVDAQLLEVEDFL